MFTILNTYKKHNNEIYREIDLKLFTRLNSSI